MKFPFLLREYVTINFEYCDLFSKALKLILISKRMKIYSIGFNYSLVTSKIFAICLLKILLKKIVLHISKLFQHILMVAIFLLNY